MRDGRWSLVVWTCIGLAAGCGGGTGDAPRDAARDDASSQAGGDASAESGAPEADASTGGADAALDAAVTGPVSAPTGFEVVSSGGRTSGGGFVVDVEIGLPIVHQAVTGGGFSVEGAAVIVRQEGP